MLYEDPRIRKTTVPIVDKCDFKMVRVEDPGEVDECEEPESDSDSDGGSEHEQPRGSGEPLMKRRRR